MVFPLLPSPERKYISEEFSQPEPSPEQLFPPNFEEIVATAAFNYISRLNDKNRSHGGPAVLPLTQESQKTAIGVILDAITIAQLAENQTVLPAKPKELRGLIKTGLGLRETERLTAKQLVDELKQVSVIGGRESVSYDLGLDDKLVMAARQEALNYPIIPRPTNARTLIDMVPARRQAVREMAVIAATGYMAKHQGDLSEAMATDEFIALNLGFVSELLNTEGKQASVDRGAIVATASGKKGRGINPTFLESKDLKQMTAVFSNPKIVREIPELAAQTAGKLLAHSPELIPTGTAAMEAFGRQVRQVVILAEKVRFSRGDDQITFLTTQAEIFKIFPTSPMLDSGTLVTRADLLPSAGPDVHHLWEDAIEIAAGPNRLALIPTPKKLISAKAFLGSIHTLDDRLNDDQERLYQAIKAWKEHETKKLTLPDKIDKLDKKIKELDKLSRGKSSVPDETTDLHPIQLDSIILAESGTISVLSRRIHQAESALAIHRQLSTVSESTNPDQFAIRFLIFRQKQAGRRLEAVEREKGENASFGQEPTFLLTDFPRRPLESKTDATPETPAEELVRIRGYLTELSADKAKALPREFLSDRQALWNYLRLGQKRFLPGKHGQDKFMKIGTGISILLNAKGDDIGRDFWRLWFIDEAKKRENMLVNRLERIERYQADKAELDLIRDALSSHDFELMGKTAQRLSGSQHSAPLDRWIKMQAVPLDFLKRLKVAGKNDISPEFIQLQQAQELVKLHRDEKSRIQMRIPHPDRVDKAINDKLRAAQNYKSTKIAAITTLNQLKLTWEYKNPLVPLNVSEGATLGELIEATASRIAVARATRELDEFVATRETARKRIAELKEFRALKEKAVSVDQLKLQRDAKIRELETADNRLFETMERLHLAAEPEMIPKSK